MLTKVGCEKSRPLLADIESRSSCQWIWLFQYVHAYKQDWYKSL